MQKNRSAASPTRNAVRAFGPPKTLLGLNETEDGLVFKDAPPTGDDVPASPGFKAGAGRRVNPKLTSAESEALFQAILCLTSVEECYAFFEDILTTAELHSIAQRWQVARLLDQGQTYDDVARSTGASSTTISRVNRSLRFGADGYRLILDRLRTQADG